MADPASNRLLKFVAEAAKTRQKWSKERSLHAVNEHLEDIFNAVLATQVEFQQPVNGRVIYKGNYRHC